MLGNNLPYGTPRFEKALCVLKIKDEKENILFMESLKDLKLNDQSMIICKEIIALHETIYKKLLEKTKTL